jgi:hypothetical protein
MVATIITYNRDVMPSRMIFLPHHDQTDNCKKQAKEWQLLAQNRHAPAR